jgi:hypothetical protein
VVRRFERRPPAGVFRARGIRYSVYVGPRVIYRGRSVWRLVGVTSLRPLTVRGVGYYPVAYAAVPRPACYGATENGCALEWMDVATEEGERAAQCVQYCPRGVRPTVAAVSGAPPQPMAAERGRCELSGYSEPGFAGGTFKTGESYPDLYEWSRQIASLRIVAGTWDFYSDENYGGDVLQFDPGEYPDLGEQWNYQISSFMCTMPGN